MKHKKSLFAKFNEDITGFRTTVLGYVATLGLLAEALTNWITEVFTLFDPLVSMANVKGAAIISTVTALYQTIKKIRE